MLKRINNKCFYDEVSNVTYSFTPHFLDRLKRLPYKITPFQLCDIINSNYNFSFIKQLPYKTLILTPFHGTYLIAVKETWGNHIILEFKTLIRRTQSFLKKGIGVTFYERRG